MVQNVDSWVWPGSRSDHAPGRAKRSKLDVDSSRMGRLWPIELPSLVADAHRFDFMGRNVSAGIGRGAARRRGRPLCRRTFWRRPLFRQADGRGSHGWTAFWLVAPWFRKSICAASGKTWHDGYPGCLAPSAARTRESCNAAPRRPIGIHSVGTAEVFLVSGFVPTRLCRQRFFLFFSVS